MSVDVELTSAIRHGDDVIDVLTIREPTARDIKRRGLPVDVSTKNIDTSVVFNYLVDLCALPPSTIDQISARDFTRCIAVIANFFGDSEA